MPDFLLYRFKTEIMVCDNPSSSIQIWSEFSYDMIVVHSSLHSAGRGNCSKSGQIVIVFFIIDRYNYDEIF